MGNLRTKKSPACGTQRYLARQHKSDSMTQPRPFWEKAPETRLNTTYWRKPDEEVTHSETARVFRKLKFHVAKQRSCRMPREKSIENDIEVAKKIMEVSAEMKSLVLYISRLRNHSYANDFDLH